MNNPNLTPEEIMKMAAAMKNADGQAESFAQTLLNRLSPEKSEKFKEILKDKAAMENILNSEQARELMKKFKK